MSAPQPKKLSRSRALTGIVVNLGATPGLGSLMCRRFVAGTGQLLLALTGFCLLVAWMGREFYRSMLLDLDRPVSPSPFGWMWHWGALCFGAAWLWSLVTSLSLLRETKSEERNPGGPVPPRIAGNPE